MIAAERTLPAALMILAAFCLGGCIGGCSDDDPPNGDSTPPTVQSTSPADGADNVPVESVIYAVFSEPVDTATISASTFAVDGNVSGVYSFSGDTVTFAPDGDLQYGVEYTATISGVADKAANVMRDDYTWSFTTEVDPATVPPKVVATAPGDGASNVSGTAPVMVYFDKAMQASSFTSDAISLSPSASGTISVTDSVATFTPDDTLQYSTPYTVTVDTVVSDTYGNNLAEPYSFGFTTRVDPLIPTAFVLHPETNDVIGDTTETNVIIQHPIGVERVEYFVDSVLVHTDSTEPFSFAWDAVGYEVASTHTFHALAYDAEGRVGSSDTVTVYYLWEKLLPGVDDNDPWPTDIKWAFARSTDSVLEMRWEFWEDWYDPYDTIPDDTTLDLAVYFDTDFNLSTGRATFGTPPYERPLNGIGADHQIIVGLHGNEAINEFSPSGEFRNVHGPEGFQYLSLPADTNVLQVGIRWSDLDSPGTIRLVGINVIFTNSDNPDEFIPDWYPNEGAGYIIYSRNSRWVGDPIVPEEGAVRPGINGQSALRANPFSGRRALNPD